MARPRSLKSPAPLDHKQLEEMALRYVGRFATTRAKLTAYLWRKVRERGWNDKVEPDFDALAQRFCEFGYLDDAAYALAKSRSLSSRGYGRHRLEQKLRLAGISEEDGAAAREEAQVEALDAALRYAERRRIGPWSSGKSDPKLREKVIAAMVRAGHPIGLAIAIASLAPGAEINREQLTGQRRITP
ncbi:MAG TPA: RecX family transcriptional regulator [Sphingomicrobium sp.]|jgi:regulatory protein|nr:RecX family transcriptional regulator [Sphingomicrobium sp.]